MFGEFNEQLTIIKSKKRKRRKLVADLQEIENELSTLKSKLVDLEAILVKEGEDVKKLEGYSLIGLFHTILGSKEQQIEKERQEYLIAKLKYDECKEAISTLMTEQAGVKQELEQLADVEQQYKLIIAEKEKVILENDDRNTQRLVGLVVYTGISSPVSATVNLMIAPSLRPIQLSCMVFTFSGQPGSLLKSCNNLSA